MTTQTQARQDPRPPDWLFKGIINPIMKFILRSPLHGLVSNGLALLTFTGRKSKQQYLTPVAYHWHSDDEIYVFTRSKWWKNLQNGESVTIRIKGEDYGATADVIQDKEQVWDIVSRYINRYDGNYRRVGIMIGDDASDDAIRNGAANMLALKFELDKVK